MKPKPRVVLSGYTPKKLKSRPRPRLRWKPKSKPLVRRQLFTSKDPKSKSKYALMKMRRMVFRRPLVRRLKLKDKQLSDPRLGPIRWIRRKAPKMRTINWKNKKTLASIRFGAVVEGYYLKYLKGNGNPNIQAQEKKKPKLLGGFMVDEVTKEDEDKVEDQVLEGNGNSGPGNQGKKGLGGFGQSSVDEMAEEGEGGEGGEQVLHAISGMFENHINRKLRSILAAILSEGRDSKSMAKVWSTLDQQECRHEFRYIAGHLLRRKHTKFCMRFLECCCIHSPYPPTPEDVAVVLEYITQWELRNHKRIHRKKAIVWWKRKEGQARRLVDLTLASLRVDYGGAFPLKQSTVYRLVRSACLEDVSRLYDGLQEAKVTLTTDTILHFISRLSDLTTWRKAYSIMELLSKDRSRNLHFPQVWKGFHTLFYNATFIGEEESSAVVRMMLDRNVNPGLSSYNILMAKASRNQDEESLTRIFRQMLEADLRPSMVTYGLLHRYYKQQGAEPERFQVMRDAMKLDSNLSVILATDIVHAKVMNSSHYLPVLDEYLEFFTPAPLVSLGIAVPEHNVITRNSARRARLSPDHITIATMVHAFCMHERDPMVVWAAYQRYQKILKTERSRERLVPLHDAGHYIPNSYMLALGCHSDTLRHCATVLEDMLRPNSPVQANAHSWSILLYAMAKAQKMNQAEQVLGAMRRKGIEPTVVTWTSLLTGYVRIGRLWQAGEVIRRMTAENVEPNHATMGLLATIIDSKEFTEGMAGVATNKGRQIDDIFGEIQEQEKDS